MKKILFAIAIVLTLGLTANAQRSDGFFGNWDNDMNDRDHTISNVSPALPGGEPGQYGDNQSAPLGTGLLILTALGAGYAVARKKK